MKKNDIITLNIDSATSEGAGIGRTPDGMAVFVNGAAQGDVLSARIIKVKKNYAVARIEQLLMPSPDRIDCDCSTFPRCGGCAWRHISYDAELRIKHRRVADALQRIGGIEAPVLPVIGGDLTDGYRNKAQYPVGTAPDGGLQIGFFANRSHRIIDCGGCRLQPPEFDDAVDAVRRYMISAGVSAYDERSHSGVMRHIYLRKAAATGEIMVCAVINAPKLPQPELLIRLLQDRLGDRLKTVVLNINRADTNVVLSPQCIPLLGDGTVTDELCGLRVRISPLSFYQVNRNMAERLYRKAAEYADCGGRTLLDLYCGAGTIGLSMAESAKRVIGVEIIPDAVRDAEYNAAQNGITNAEFLCADARSAAQQMAAEGVHPDIVVIDPPRKGLEDGLPRLIAQDFAPERVVYVSCDPATLARDCSAFAEYGYIVREAQPFDLFPRTAHVETVVLLSRN